MGEEGGQEGSVAFGLEGGIEGRWQVLMPAAGCDSPVQQRIAHLPGSTGLLPPSSPPPPPPPPSFCPLAHMRDQQRVSIQPGDRRRPQIQSCDRIRVGHLHQALVVHRRPRRRRRRRWPKASPPSQPPRQPPVPRHPAVALEAGRQVRRWSEDVGMWRWLQRVGNGRAARRWVGGWQWRGGGQQAPGPSLQRV